MRRLTLASLLALGATPALADDGSWSYRLSPYAWIPSASIDAAIDSSPSTSSDTSLFDLLDFAALFSGEVRNDDWAVLLEVNFLDLSDHATRAGGFVDIEVELDGAMAGAALARRIAGGDGTRLDAFAGARLWSVDAKIDYRLLPDAAQDATFVDPILGLRGEVELGERWTLSALADVGGFGLGSDFQWEAVARGAYRLTEHTALSLGYRHLEIGFDRDGLDATLAVTGPFVAFDLIW